MSSRARGKRSRKKSESPIVNQPIRLYYYLKIAESVMAVARNYKQLEPNNVDLIAKKTIYPGYPLFRERTPDGQIIPDGRVIPINMYTLSQRNALGESMITEEMFWYAYRDYITVLDIMNSGGGTFEPSDAFASFYLSPSGGPPILVRYIQADNPEKPITKDRIQHEYAKIIPLIYSVPEKFRGFKGWPVLMISQTEILPKDVEGKELLPFLEVFTFRQLLARPADHVLSPAQIRLFTDEEKREAMLDLTGEDGHIKILPMISTEDPISRFYKYTMGQYVLARTLDNFTRSVLSERYEGYVVKDPKAIEAVQGVAVSGETGDADEHKFIDLYRTAQE